MALSIYPSTRVTSLDCSDYKPNPFSAVDISYLHPLKKKSN